ncbi:restriction endonuclease [bacterium]|nr:restriction endonuclease [bacterium]
MEALQKRKMEIYKLARETRRNALERAARVYFQRVENVRMLSPQNFEDLIADMFKKLGYSVTQTPYTNDQGRDAIALKGGKKFLIECKRYAEDQRVGRPEIQKFLGAMLGDKADGGFFVTTSRFTATAIECARGHNVELIGIDRLGELLSTVFPQESDKITIEAICRECADRVVFSWPNGPISLTCSKQHSVSLNVNLKDLKDAFNGNVVICAKCGNQMRVVSGRRGKFWGCTAYPQCRATQQI